MTRSNGKNSIVTTNSTSSQTNLPKISNGKVRGYRRYEVIGAGLSHTKAGYWWVVTADNDYKVADLLASYHRFWGNPEAVYIEVLRSRDSSRYEK